MIDRSKLTPRERELQQAYIKTTLTEFRDQRIPRVVAAAQLSQHFPQIVITTFLDDPAETLEYMAMSDKMAKNSEDFSPIMKRFMRGMGNEVGKMVEVLDEKGKMSVTPEEKAIIVRLAAKETVRKMGDELIEAMSLDADLAGEVAEIEKKLVESDKRRMGMGRN